MPASERSWARGADGEALVAQSLHERCGTSVLLLHDRRMPRSRANIDHVAITANGVWVIDTKHYRGRIKVQRQLFQKPKLLINGRDRSKLVEGLDRQVAVVRRELEPFAPGVPVRGALCVIDAQLPLFLTVQFRGYPVLYRRALAKRLNASGPLDSVRIRSLSERLASLFPPA